MPLTDLAGEEPAPAFVPLIKSVVTEGWGWFYSGLAMAFGEHWQVDKPTADLHTARTLAWVHTWDKRKLAQLEKKWGKYAPPLLLLSTLGETIGPRAAQTIANARAKRRPQPAPVVPRGPVPQNAPAPAPEPVERAAPRASYRPEPEHVEPEPIAVHPNVHAAPRATNSRATHRAARGHDGRARDTRENPLVDPSGISIGRFDADIFDGGDDGRPM